MRLFKDKKGEVGDSTQPILFLSAEFIAGTLFIVGMILIVVNNTTASDTQKIANELAVLIATISHEINEIHYHFYLPEDITYVAIENDKITVFSDTERATANIKKNKEITLASSPFINPEMLSIFFSYRDKAITFERYQGMDCEKRRLADKEQRFRLITIGTPEEQKILKELETYIRQKSLRNQIFTENLDAQIIELSFHPENKFIIETPANTPTLSAINCYLTKFLEELNPEDFQEIKLTTELKQEIRIKIGAYTDMAEKTKEEQESILIAYAGNISNSLIKGMQT